MHSCNNWSTRFHDQRTPFSITGQVPAAWANTLGWQSLRASHSITTACLYGIHSRSPGVKATILCTAIRGIFVTNAILHFVVQVFRHPYLTTDFYSSVSLAVAQILQRICRGVVFTAGIYLSRTAGCRNNSVITFDAADRVPKILSGITPQAYVDIVIVQVHRIRAAVTGLRNALATALRRTPEARSVTHAVVTRIADACRQRREPECVSAIAAFTLIVTPAIGRLQFRASSFFATHGLD